MEKENFGRHISELMNQNLEDLFNHILEMGGLVERQFEAALVALGSSDTAKASEVVAFDKIVNQAEMEIDKLCSRVLARQQPTASDLRLILAAIRIAIDLERMGDEIVKIAKMVVMFGHSDKDIACSELPGYGELMDISTRSNQMLKTALDDFARVSTEGAGELIQEEERIDVIFAEAMADLKGQLRSRPDEVECLMEMIIALRAAERVSDHARNVIESIVYLVKGKDLRNMDQARLTAFLSSLDEEQA
ncbi:phosphate signaling complex protein PhoU [Thiomicrospira sp. WB1]|uniref:phosphate signaling complex protein PhoU n=1 Tax=Thiomicrospira sp. WB1 TaxID=1685380 RepID=UPI000749C5C6|nr:phosphate signaling complex protein PhoU [Thiomicrospira sp. WB1]KUJ71513.1 PhoU family transcriptional regulator [Thiomicrospira sp. WB1]